MQTASVPLTVMLCGSAVLMVSGTLTRLQVEEAMEARAAEAADIAEAPQDGELEGEGVSFAGDVLFAAPDLSDPYFSGSVIYLMAHDETGAFGVVLNRPRYLGAREAVVFDGGPVGRDRVVVLHDDPHRGVEIEQGIYAAADPAIIDDVMSGDAFGHVFVGYAGWGPGQLEREMAEGSWLVSDATAISVLGMRPPADHPTPY